MGARAAKVANSERFVCGDCWTLLREVMHRDPTPKGVKTLQYGTACHIHAQVSRPGDIVPSASTWVRASDKELQKAQALLVERFRAPAQPVYGAPVGRDADGVGGIWGVNEPPAAPPPPLDEEERLVSELAVHILLEEGNGMLPHQIAGAVVAARSVLAEVKKGSRR